MMTSFVIMSLEPLKCAVHLAAGFCLDLRKGKEGGGREPRQNQRMQWREQGAELVRTVSWVGMRGGRQGRMTGTTLGNAEGEET